MLENGVSHVMGLFMKHATEEGLTTRSQGQVSTPPAQRPSVSAKERNLAVALVEVECDEAGLDPVDLPEVSKQAAI